MCFSSSHFTHPVGGETRHLTQGIMGNCTTFTWEFGREAERVTWWISTLMCSAVLSSDADLHTARRRARFCTLSPWTKQQQKKLSSLISTWLGGYFCEARCCAVLRHPNWLFLHVLSLRCWGTKVCQATRCFFMSESACQISAREFFLSQFSHSGFNWTNAFYMAAIQKCIAATLSTQQSSVSRRQTCVWSC